MRRNLILVPLALFAPVLAAQDTKEVETFIKAAVTFAKANPREAFLAEVLRPTGQFNVQKTKRLYLTVYDLEGKVIGHGKKAQEVGANQFDAKDKTGKLYIQERIKLAKAKGGGWVEETKINPANMQAQVKKTFVGFHNGMVICCGMYEGK
jgi:signal transduction histidine kinase